MHIAASCCKLLQAAASCCKLLQAAASCCKLLQAPASCYKLLHASACYFKFLHALQAAESCNDNLYISFCKYRRVSVIDYLLRLKG
jgi:hypothetical protein